MGRKKIEIDWTKLTPMLQLGASLEMCAGVFECSEDTIENKIKEEFGVTFRELRNQKMATTKIKLLQKGLSKAFDGDNTLLIFCLKNLCGWSDKVSNETELKGNLDVNVNDIIARAIADKKRLGSGS